VSFVVPSRACSAAGGRGSASARSSSASPSRAADVDDRVRREPHRSPVGSVFESMSRHSGLVLSLRNTQRAAALVVLGLAGLGTAAIVALRRRRPRAGLGCRPRRSSA
jgi:hypothetical protein